MIILDYSTLYDLIRFLENGTKLHIGVIFLGNYGNEKLILPYSHTIHTSVLCQNSKETKNPKRCYKCRKLALKKAIETKKSFGGVCINGIYEYFYPVIENDKVVAVIFIGNILKENNPRLMQNLCDYSLLDTLQSEFTENDCFSLAALIESYIKLIVKEYPVSDSSDFSPLIENVKSHIEENIQFDISINSVAKTFNYNEKYLGRLFKKKTGLYFNDYVMTRRVHLAKELLKTTSYSISDISLNLGFNTHSYFNKIFKKLCGITPSEYRKYKR